VAYLGKEDQNGRFDVNWPGIFTFPEFYGVAMQVDDNYRFGSRSSNRAVFRLGDLFTDETKTGFTGSPTLFWQVLFDRIQDDLNGVDIDNRNTVEQELSDVEQMVLVNAGGITLGRDAILKDGIKLKVYYTRLR
jgi:hypothetical protein